MKRFVRLWLNTQRWAGSIIGPTFMILGIAWAVQTLNFLHHARNTTGTVVALKPYRDDDGTSYATIFQFSSEDSAVHTVESSLHTQPAGFSIGEKLPVAYDGDQPENARIATFMQLWFMATGFGVCGLLASIFSAWLWHRHLRKPSNQPLTAHTA